jgi:malate dehydrogenase (oxaloacetate-decarboxylating)
MEIQAARQCNLTGTSLLQDPHFNKGTAFTDQERRDFGLTGLLPSRINSLEEQAHRAYEQFQTHRTPLGKNTFMTSMKEQNEVLFYRLLQDHLKEMFSIIYTPTEGDAIAEFSRIFRRSEGCFLNIEDPDSIETSLAQWKDKDVDVIVCSDGEQILGW